MIRAFVRLRVSAGEQTADDQQEEGQRQALTSSPRSLVTETVSVGAQAMGVV